MRTQQIFQSIHQGILICDSQSRIIYFNESYGDFISKTLPEVKGTPIQQLRPGSRIPDVIRSGIPAEYILRHEEEQSYFANIYPIMENGEVTGTISIVTTLDAAREAEEKDCRSLKERVRQFEQQQIAGLLAIYGDDTQGKQKVAEHLDISLATLYNKIC